MKKLVCLTNDEEKTVIIYKGILTLKDDKYTFKGADGFIYELCYDEKSFFMNKIGDYSLKIILQENNLSIIINNACGLLKLEPKLIKYDFKEDLMLSYELEKQKFIYEIRSLNE